MFDLAKKVMNSTSSAILVANGRVVDYTGDSLESTETLSLIGKAIELNLIPFDTKRNGQLLVTQNSEKKIKNTREA